MKDRVPGAPGQYSAVIPEKELQKLQTGQPFAITLTRDDKPIVPGTPYSKAAVLPDELASKICPGMNDPAPKDAFAALHENVAKLQNDYIVAQGTKDGWVFRQWASGFAECWGSFTNSIVTGNRLPTFPFLFSGDPVKPGHPMTVTTSISTETEFNDKIYEFGIVGFEFEGVRPRAIDFQFIDKVYLNNIGGVADLEDAYDGYIYSIPEGVTLNINVTGTWMGDIPESSGVTYHEITAKIVDGVLVIR